MACASALIALVGFSRRYLLPVTQGTFDAPTIVHLHGIITFGWVAFVVLQAVLVATGRTPLHRSVGLAGIALGTLLIFTATQVVVLLLAREFKEGGPSPREFAATLLSTILLIVVFFAVAIAKVNRPEVHKRLMTLATLVVLTPALARIIQLCDASLSRLARNDLAVAASDALILIAIAHDAWTRGRPHPAYVAGGAFLLPVQATTLLVRTTPVWHGFTTWLASLAR